MSSQLNRIDLAENIVLRAEVERQAERIKEVEGFLHKLVKRERACLREHGYCAYNTLHGAEKLLGMELTK